MKKLIFLLLLVLLAALGVVYYKKWRKEFVHKKIPELVFLESDSLYRITYDTVDIDEVDGEIMIKNLQLIPDSTYKKPTDSTLPRNLLRVTVPEVYITGIQTDAAMLDKEILASKIKLTSPVVTMFNNRRGAKNNDNGNDTAATTDKIYRILLRGLQKIKVDTIIITDADYHICKWPNGDTVFSGSKINAKLHNILISDSTSTDTSRILFAENASLDVKKVLFRSKNKFYNYVFTDIKLLSAERSFAVEKLQIVPLMGEAAFMRAFKWQTDRLDFDLYDLLFKQVNVQEILNGNLISNQLIIKKASLKIFRDKSYPEKKEKKVGHYPHQDLLKIPIDVALKKITVQSGYIEYKEKNPQTGSSGVLVFDNVSASLLNVSNRNNNGIMTVNFNSRFLSRIPLSATLQFYMNNKNGKFTANGSMKTTDATIFNTLSKPMALVEINSGTINSLDFNLICDDYKAKGIIRLLYNDLRIKILKQEETGDAAYKSKKVISLLANLTIADANPDKNKPVRIVTVNHQRNTYRSMFNLIWKAIFEGAQKTVGIDGKLKAKQ
jgi:hypothetical protein